MNTREKLTADMKAAMKAQDTQTRDTLRLVLAALKQVEVDGQQTLDEAGVQVVLAKQAKQRRDSIAEYDKAGRAELVEVEKAELTVIERYLPQMMSREEIVALVRPLMAELGVTDVKGMGAVMGRLMPQVKGKADGRLVNQVVRELLSS